jgi:hypothetical protein
VLHLFSYSYFSLELLHALDEKVLQFVLLLDQPNILAKQFLIDLLQMQVVFFYYLLIN